MRFKIILMIMVILGVFSVNAAFHDGIRFYLPMNASLTDSLGNNSGTGYSATSQPSSGIIAGAYELSGLTGSQITTSFTYNSRQDITMCAWVYPHGKTSEYQAIIANSNSGGSYGWFIYIDTDKKPAVYTTGTGYGSCKSNDTLTDNTWALVCGTYDNTNKKEILYINGVRKCHKAYSAVMAANNGDIFVIGRAGSYNGRNLDGMVDEAFIATRVLTPGEITALYNAGSGRTYDIRPTVPSGSSLSNTNKTGETLTATGAGGTTNNDIRHNSTSPSYWYRFNCNSSGGTFLQGMGTTNTYVINSSNCPVGQTIYVNIWRKQGTVGNNISATPEIETKVVQSSSTCSCAGAGTNWVINHADSCLISSTCNLSTGKLSFTGTGTTRCNASIYTNEMGDPGSSGTLSILSGCKIYVS